MLNEKITNPKFISGLIKECIFFTKNINLQHNNKYYTCTIIDYLESKSWDDLENCSVVISACKDLITNTDDIVELSCGFSNFFAQFSCKVKSTKNSSITLSAPIEVTLTNKRKSTRFTIASDEKSDDHAAVVYDGTHSSAGMILQDISDHGWGAVLTLPEQVPFDIGSNIVGFVKRPIGQMKLDGTVTKIELAEEYSTPKGYVAYRVGVARKENNSKKNSLNTINKRRVKRHKIDRSLVLYSMLNSSKSIVIKINEASLLGFTGIIESVADRYLLPIGAIAECKDFKIAVRHVRSEGDVVSFEVVSGDDVSMLKWLKNIERAQDKNLSTSSRTGQEILSLFCQSGIMAVPYLHNQKERSHLLLPQYAKDENYSAWLHRWLHQDSKGFTESHVSAVRFGDACWYIGDVIKSQNSKSTSSSFIANFLASFNEYLENLSYMPTVFFGWKRGHKYWREFDQWIHSKLNKNEYSFIKAKYIRSENCPNIEHIEITKINNRNVDEILGDILPNIQNSGLKAVLCSLDLTSKSLGSPSLAKLIHQSEFNFFREYFLIKDKKNGIRSIAILSNYPRSASPLNNENIPWFIPIEAHTAEIRAVMTSAMLAHSLQSGYVYPGSLYLLDSENEQFDFEWYIGTPKCLRYFKESQAQ